MRAATGSTCCRPTGTASRSRRAGSLCRRSTGPRLTCAALVPQVDGAWIERKRFAIAVHFRAVDAHDVPRLTTLVTTVARSHAGLRMTGGKKIVELRPDVPWDKGRALEWILAEATGEDTSVLPVYLGDDETDEDAFRVIRSSGVGVVVGDEDRATAAHCRLADTVEVGMFLARLTGVGGCR